MFRFASPKYNKRKQKKKKKLLLKCRCRPLRFLLLYKISVDKFQIKLHTQPTHLLQLISTGEQEERMADEESTVRYEQNWFIFYNQINSEYTY